MVFDKSLKGKDVIYSNVAHRMSVKDACERHSFISQFSLFLMKERRCVIEFFFILPVFRYYLIGLYVVCENRIFFAFLTIGTEY